MGRFILSLYTLYICLYISIAAGPATPRSRPSMRGCNVRALAAAPDLANSPRLAGLAVKRLPSGLERHWPHIREEQLFVRARESFDGLFQRQPFHGFDIVH